MPQGYWSYVYHVQCSHGSTWIKFYALRGYTQIYLFRKPARSHYETDNCLTHSVKKNMLKINAQKTELFLIKVHPSSSAASVMVDTHVSRETWAYICQLQLREHIFAVWMSALKRIAQIRHFMSTKTTEKYMLLSLLELIHNALLFGIPEKDLSKLQTVKIVLPHWTCKEKRSNVWQTG